FLTGVARYLFVPLAEAVVFAILASYLISRTLVPTLVMWLYCGVNLHRERLAGEVNIVIQEVVPAGYLGGILDNIGIPNSSINLSYNTSGVIGAGDVD